VGRCGGGGGGANVAFMLDMACNRVRYQKFGLAPGKLQKGDYDKIVGLREARGLGGGTVDGATKGKVFEGLGTRGRVWIWVVTLQKGR